MVSLSIQAPASARSREPASNDRRTQGTFFAGTAYPAPRIHLAEQVFSRMLRFMRISTFRLYYLTSG